MNLVRDLAVILISAGLFTIISKALRQPLILGYIIAGFLVGPNINFFPGISSVEAVEQWSEIGIIFLMFGLGLEFSFKKLLKVGSSALVTAGTKFLGVFVLGFVIGTAMGWTTMESIFLAGLLSMSSTTVVIKSYEEMNMKNDSHAGLVFGTLVVEDLIAILLMVLLSTMAVSKKFDGAEMLFNLGKLAFFIVLWFLVGIYLIPSVLSKAKKYISDEILLVVSVGLCLGMVSLASAVGFSSALGAFVMGSILAETVESEHIEHLVSPIKDLFGAIFFVSVGMMISPSVIAEHWLTILILTLVVIISHIIFSAAGVILTGKGLKNGVFTGFSLAQLGEFGFILASVGVTLGVMRDFIYPVIIAVSVITTFTTPYMIKLARPTYSLLCKKMPKGMLKRLETNKDEGSRSMKEKSEWEKLLRLYALRVVLYGVILIALFIGSSVFLSPMLSSALAEKVSEPMLHVITLAITLGIMTPFLFGIAVSTGDMNHITSKLYKEKKNRIPLIGLVLLRIFIALGFIMAVIAKNVNLEGWALLLILVAAVIFLLIARFSVHRFSFIEKKFIANLNEREEAERKAKPVTTSIRNKLSGYDVHLEKIKISPDSLFVGQTFQDISFRKKTGANIIKLTRGSHHIIIPSSSTILYPHDELIAVGTTEQIQSFREMITSSTEVLAHEKESEFIVHTITLEEDSFLTGKTVRQPQMKRQRCMIISVLRGEDFITNPDPDFVFAVGDIVWLAGEKSAVQSY
ncbi:MAG: cation:proton antiporter [Bacteroidales bacterium]|nr:cation:proton antiporter [Bacteroidales bacterium]